MLKNHRFSIFACMLPLGAVFIFLNLSCSVLLDFDEDERPCTEDRACLPGFTCEVAVCKRDNVNVVGQTCATAARCTGDLICANFVCNKPCTTLYSDCTYDCDEKTCPPGVCMPAAIEVDLWRLACLPTICTSTDDTCTAPNASTKTCVTGNDSNGVCYTPCTLNCGLSGCTDSCSVGNDKTSSCQPLGATNTLTCLGIGTAGAGDACTLFHGNDGQQSMCNSGLACVDNLCRAYCDLAAPSCTAGTCTDHTTYATCEP